MELVPQLDARIRGPASGSPVVVVVQSTHHWKSDHLLAGVMRGKSWSARFRNLLRHPLMWSCLVKVGDIGIEHALELLLVEDEEMVQAFLLHTSQEAFTDGIGSRSVMRRFENLYAACRRYPSKARPELAVVITNEIFRCLPIRSRFSELLNHPGI